MRGNALIAAEHQKHGLQPRPEAWRQVLSRRVYSSRDREDLVHALFNHHDFVTIR